MHFSIVNVSNQEIPLDLLLLADPSKEMIYRYIEQSEVFVAQEKDQVIGVLALKMDENTSEIMNVAVDPGFQKRGVGSKLIRHSIEFAKSSDIQRIIIGTADTSKTQLTLYKKLGFSVFERVTNFFAENYPNPIMENGKRARDMIKLEIKLTKDSHSF
ncbi:MAG: GNAT family N-acetyltransferase [Ekhidna sp.]